MWRNDIKCRYMFMFSLKNLACKGLKLRKGMGYLALTGELWGVIFVDFGENWPCYNDTIPYHILIYGKKVWIHLDSSTHWPPVDFNESLEKHNKISNISRIKFQNLDVSRLVLQLPLPNPLMQGVCQEWRCSWSNANRRCSKYIWVINNFIAY